MPEQARGRDHNRDGGGQGGYLKEEAISLPRMVAAYSAPSLFSMCVSM